MHCLRSGLQARTEFDSQRPKYCLQGWLGGTRTSDNNYQLVVCRVLASLVESPARVFAEQVDNLKRCKSLKVATKATKSSQIKKCSGSNAFGALDTNERRDSAIWCDHEFLVKKNHCFRLPKFFVHKSLRQHLSLGREMLFFLWKIFSIFCCSCHYEHGLWI